MRYINQILITKQTPDGRVIKKRITTYYPDNETEICQTKIEIDDMKKEFSEWETAAIHDLSDKELNEIMEEIENKNKQ